MEQNDRMEPPGNVPSAISDVPSPETSTSQRVVTAVRPRVEGQACATCDAASNGESNGGEGTAYPFVYALGRVEARFPSLGVEKEFSQAVGRADTTGQTDPQAFHKVLSQPENRYLVKQVCWVFSIEGMETYILQPRDPVDFGMLLEAIRPVPRRTDVDVIVGVRGPMATADLCNGLLVPVAVFDQIYSFDVESLVKSIPKPKDMTADKFSSAAEDLFNRIMQLADNAGATDEHRALNYLAVRYHAIYHRAAEEYGRNASLSGVEVRPSRLSGVRKIMDVIFSFTNRTTDVTEKFFVRVDVSEEFPFLKDKLQPYIDH